MKKIPLLILVSGGRSSAKMAYHVHNSPKYDKYDKLFCFCNTGQEKKETIEFLKNMVEVWGIPIVPIEGVYNQVKGIGIRHRVVDFDNLDMKSDVFKQMIRHANKHKQIGVPNMGTPYCSHYLKVLPAHSFAREIFGTPHYIKSIGYRFEDMPKRITFAELKEDGKVIAPLLTDFESPITQNDLNLFFEKQPFKLELHSKFGNCELCWKKSELNLIENIQNGVRIETLDFYRESEIEFDDYFFRGNKSIESLIADAESGTQLNLFDNTGDNCVCSFNSSTLD